MACLSKIVVGCVVLGAGALQNLGPDVEDSTECSWDSAQAGDLKKETRSCLALLEDGVDYTIHCTCNKKVSGRTCKEVSRSGYSGYRCALPECKVGAYSSSEKTCLKKGVRADDNNRCACPDDLQCSESTETCLPKCEGEGSDTCSGDNATCTCGSGRKCEEGGGAQYGGKTYECPETDISTPVVDATVAETAVDCSSVSGSTYNTEESGVGEFTTACKAQGDCEAVFTQGATVCNDEAACECKQVAYAQTQEDALVSSAQKCFSWFAVLVMILQL